MPRVLFTSDCHFGFSQRTKSLWVKTLKSVDWSTVDVVVLVGDIMSHEPRHLQTALKTFRAFYSGNIYAVRGNHDFWASAGRSLDFQIQKTDKIFAEYDVIQLHNNAQVMHSSSGNVHFVGFDCWYSQSPAGWTRDLYRIPGDAEKHEQLAKRSDNGFHNLIDTLETIQPGEKIVAAIHMPPSSWAENRHLGTREVYWERLSERCTAILYGHTHRFDSRNISGVEVRNAGADYDRPRVEFIDI